MPGPTTGKLATLVVGVLIAHLLGLTWLAHQATDPGALTPMAEPEFNRAITPDNPPSNPPDHATSATPSHTPTVGQVVQARTLLAPPPTHTIQQKKRPPASTKHNQTPTQAPLYAEQVPSTPPPEQPLPPAPEILSAEQNAAPPELEKKEDETLDFIKQFATKTNIDSQALLDTWPANTRLTYDLNGHYKGGLSGSARVQWQRNADQYQIQINVSAGWFLHMRMTSQGRVTPTRLWPETYEEERTGKKNSARLGDQWLRFQDGTNLPRPDDLQDAASQFVQLAQDFATGRRNLTVGESIRIPLARHSGVTEWTYDVVAQDVLPTPLGDLQAFHLKPRPQTHARGKVGMDIWFAPALQYMPARIKLSLNEDAWLDMTLTAAAQSP